MDDLRREIISLKQELRAINHHRNVLRESLDQLEGQLKRRFDFQVEGTPGLLFDASPGPGLDPKQQLDDSMTSGKAPERSSDDDVLRKQVARFRARSAALEEVVSIYRSGLMALYPDGSSYSATQMNAADKAGKGGWAAGEVALLRRSFEDELKLLEAEVDELRGRLKQGASYISELRKRLEESLRANYK